MGRLVWKSAWLVGACVLLAAGARAGAQELRPLGAIWSSGIETSLASRKMGARLRALAADFEMEGFADGRRARAEAPARFASGFARVDGAGRVQVYAFLTDTDPHTLEETLASVDLARAMGPATVLVTSVLRPDAAPDTLEMLAVHGDEAWLVATPRLPMKANGSGDVTAALFTAHLLATGSAKDALERTVSSVYDLLRLTLESGERELQLIAAQDRIAEPALQFSAERVR